MIVKVTPYPGGMLVTISGAAVRFPRWTGAELMGGRFDGGRPAAYIFKLPWLAVLWLALHSQKRR